MDSVIVNPTTVSTCAKVLSAATKALPYLAAVVVVAGAGYAAYHYWWKEEKEV